jgi:hypothetical protein
MGEIKALSDWAESDLRGLQNAGKSGNFGVSRTEPEAHGWGDNAKSTVTRRIVCEVYRQLDCCQVKLFY